MFDARDAGAFGAGGGLCAWAPKQSHAKSSPPAPGGSRGGCRPPATHCEPVTLHHFIKLLINLFIFLLRLRGQRKHFIPFRALALPVLLVQRLLRRWGGTRGCRGGIRGEVWGEIEQKRNKTEQRIYNEGFLATRWVLTPYRLNRISRSSLPLRYLSSIKGLWSMESSPSGSGLSQPLNPFFLNVCKHNRDSVRSANGDGEHGQAPPKHPPAHTDVSLHKLMRCQ